MLAPRKKLWSTPDSVIERVTDWIKLRPSDTVCDIGCGDGRVLLQWAASHHVRLQKEKPSSACSVGDDDGDNHDESLMPSFIGIDIDEERIGRAHARLKKARDDGSIPEKISVVFHCANALECPHLYREATIFFLYLIPRGLRIIKPLMIQHLEGRDGFKGSSIQVLTYVSPLEGETPLRMDKIEVPHQPGAHWPVYHYKLEKRTTVE